MKAENNSWKPNSEAAVDINRRTEDTVPSNKNVEVSNLVTGTGQ